MHVTRFCHSKLSAAEWIDDVLPGAEAVFSCGIFGTGEQ